MQKSLSLIAIVAALSSGASLARASSVQLFNYNVVVTGTMYGNSSDIAGQTIVNNLSDNNYTVFGSSLTTGDALSVAGTTSGSLTLQHGVFHHNNSIAGVSINYNNGSTNALDTVASTNLAMVSSQMNSISSTFAAESATTGTSAIINSNNVLNFAYTGSSTGEVVFSIPGSDLSTLSGIQFNLGTATSAVINVTGSGSYSVGSNFNFSGVSSSIYNSVLWNFASASAFTTSQVWAGSILGPSLDLTPTNTQINGSVYVQTFNQSSEVHGYYFNGPVPANTPGVAVPLPSPLTAGAGLLVALGGARLVRSRRA